MEMGVGLTSTMNLAPTPICAKTDSSYPEENGIYGQGPLYFSING